MLFIGEEKVGEESLGSTRFGFVQTVDGWNTTYARWTRECATTDVFLQWFLLIQLFDDQKSTPLLELGFFESIVQEPFFDWPVF